MAKTYTVTAPLAIVRNSEQGGRQEYVYQGSPLPSYVSGEEVQRLLDADLIAEVGQAEEDGVTPVTTSDQLNTTLLVEPAKQPAKSTTSK